MRVAACTAPRHVQPCGMQLHQYLATRRLTQRAFAAQIGVKATTLHGWLSGRRPPNLRAMRAVALATGNRVRPNDWAAAKDVA